MPELSRQREQVEEFLAYTLCGKHSRNRLYRRSLRLIRINTCDMERQTDTRGVTSKEIGHHARGDFVVGRDDGFDQREADAID